ncbi:DNA translocase SpoIIIE [Paraliobacillus quinghaiensis]|uniref:DNA translocase SpoIIIE n=1 Tax=Paraliobacillus quinghaiensis TaxID=470815 RepID=A0A917WQQ4_9BACI|nr:DNA translocase FtsK [Paraliobacillus quinghaiensis]GGM21865.1 DNA translocase SpoIIIE [Paraliobacillus quinghaiensis]
MAKTKRKKNKRNTKKLQQQLKYELLGILFIFLAVFGSGASAISEGVIPSVLEDLFHLLFGAWYMIASLALLSMGFYMLIKRQVPNLINRRFLGLLIVFLGALLWTHIGTYEPILQDQEQQSVIKTTYSYYRSFLDGEVNSSYLGGGMTGALLFAFCYILFSATGAQIVALFTIIIGIIFVTDLSIGELLNKMWQKMKKICQRAYASWKSRRQTKLENKQSEEDGYSEDVITIDNSYSNLSDEPVIEEFPDIAYASSQISQETEQKEESIASENDKSKENEPETVEPLPMTELENVDYLLPPMKLLNEPKNQQQHRERSTIQTTVRKLERTFQSFGVKAKVTKVHVGPAVTKYEVYPEAGVKVSKIVNLHDDLALALAAKDIRIEAPIPGKSAIGIEVPNSEVATVSLREVLETKQAQHGSILSFVLGRDISGDAIVGELNRLPHLLVAGATGSGKSVCINGIITSILMRAKPHEVKMMMIDPKKVELNIYNGIPHLLAPVVTDPKKASRALKKVVAEMERRYDLFSDTGNRNIEGYNEYIKRYNMDEENQQPLLPYIVVLVDELADLMMVASNEVEDAITRLAQMARAAGIHLIIATQRPSVDVITGVIKANIPSRIAFSVSSQIDSRTILDSGGAEKLLGRGDMLYIPVGASKPTRIQGAFLSDEEVERIVDHCVEQQKAQYQDEMIPEEESEVKQEAEDELFDDAVKMIVELQSASVSMLQRRFRIGYSRAARLIDAMEARGIVGGYEGSKPRSVLISEYPEQKSS